MQEVSGSIPLSSTNRKIQCVCDKARYRQRNIIERTINQFKDFRRIATRFDRNIKNRIRWPRD